MKADEIKKLPFWETIGRSFKYVLKNKKLLKTGALIVLCLLLVQMALAFPMMCALDETQCSKGYKNVLNIAIFALVSIGIIINYCRSIILKANIEFLSFSFMKRMTLYVFASITLSVLVSLPTVVILTILIIGGLQNMFLYLLTIIFIFMISIFFAPIFLVFPAISVDDKSLLKASKLYEITKGNKAAIFFGQFILMTPYWVLSSMFSLFYNHIEHPAFIANIVFCAVIIILGVLDAAFKGAYFAHIYQFFTFYSKKKNK